MNVIQRIHTALDEAREVIRECDRESHIQNLLREQLGCKKRYTLPSEKYPNAEIDLFGEHFVIEVKYNKSHYAGIGQIFALKELYDMENCVLFHVQERLSDAFVHAFKDLTREIGVHGFLMDQSSNRIIYNEWRKT